MFKGGDLVGVGLEYPIQPESIGVVTGIISWGRVMVYWPISKKISCHERTWADLHLEILSEGI